MSGNLYTRPSQPDVLEVIANLSNDAVFTPPRVVNAVLDLLPEHVWKDPSLRWLDPGSKTGVFPREITKRLMVGLGDVISDEQERLDHILKNMVFAIATEAITGLMTRRSLYCSKDASSSLSAAQLPTPDGNVWHRRVEHAFDAKGRCTECGGTSEQLEHPDRDNRAYGFIHKEGRNKIAKEINMKFDVVVGNPPYQMDADAEGQNIVPLYNAFVEEAMKLNPSFISMIIPSRWMAGGKSLDQFREAMLNDRRLRKIEDFAQMGELFPGVDFEGGVCYFLWEQAYDGDCEHRFHQGEFTSASTFRNLSEFDIFVRDARALPILRKVLKKNELPLSQIVSTRDPFGSHLTSSFRKFRTGTRQKNDVSLYMVEGGKRVEKIVPFDQITRNFDAVSKWKLLVPKAYGERGAISARVLGPTQIAPPKSAASVTFLFVGPFESRAECESLDAYLSTRFARFLVSLRKVTQNTTQSTFEWVPQQLWDRPWTDAELYKKYGINKEEQTYIESMVRELPV